MGPSPSWPVVHLTEAAKSASFAKADGAAPVETAGPLNDFARTITDSDELVLDVVGRE